MREYYEVHDSNGLFGRYKTYIEALRNAYYLSVHDEYVQVNKVVISIIKWEDDIDLINGDSQV